MNWFEIFMAIIGFVGLSTIILFFKKIRDYYAYPMLFWKSQSYQINNKTFSNILIYNPSYKNITEEDITDDIVLKLGYRSDYEYEIKAVTNGKLRKGFTENKDGLNFSSFPARSGIFLRVIGNNSYPSLSGKISNSELGEVLLGKCFYKRPSSRLLNLINFIIFVALVSSYLVISKYYIPIPEEKTLGFILWVNTSRISLLLFSIGFLFEVFKFIFVLIFLAIPEELIKYFKNR